MAVPNYTYLKLKIPGPGGVITVSTSFRRAYECEVECCGHATAIVTSRELAAIKKEVTEEALDAKKLWQNLLNYRAHMHLSLSNDF